MAHRVVIVGGGFGGLAVAKGLKEAPVEVTLIDRRNFHLFQPLLYQVATGGLSPANIATPLRSLLSGQKNARVLLGEATAFDLDGRRVLLRDGEVPYDTLVVATGAQHHYFGHDEWSADAPGLKTIEDALEIRRRILLAFETAERSPRGEREGQLTFAIAGAGPTGVELAGTLVEIARYTLAHDFHNIRPIEARIILLEAGDRVLPGFPPALSAKAQRALEHKGVEVRLRTMVVDVSADGVSVKTGEQTQLIPARTVLWAAGVMASPLSRVLAEAADVTPERGGRLPVGPDLSLAGHPEVFVIGDLAHVVQDGESLAAMAPMAIQQGEYVAKLIPLRLAGGWAPVFRYRDQGLMATIGRSAAVARVGPLQLDGFLGWVTWLVVHLASLARLENRLLVLTQWGWNYFTRNRSALLITERGSDRTSD
jgi:NADH dehydrogenase